MHFYHDYYQDEDDHEPRPIGMYDSSYERSWGIERECKAFECALIFFRFIAKRGFNVT